MKEIMKYVPVDVKLTTAIKAEKYENKPIVEYGELQGYGEPRPKTISSNYWECRVTLEEFKAFCNSADKMIEYFGKERIEKFLPTLSMLNLTTKEFYPQETALSLCRSPYYKNWMICGKLKTSMVKVHKGEWEKEERKNGFDVIHASNYRSWESDFIKLCLLDKWPWLEQFKISVYGMDNAENYEFYVTIVDDDMGRGSLYVPIKALLAGDSSIIVKRMKSYFWNYYNMAALTVLKEENADEVKKEIWANREVNYNRTMALLESEQGKLFLKYVNEGADIEEEKDTSPVEIKIYGRKYKYIFSRVYQGRLIAPWVYDDFNEAYKALCYFINAVAQGREDEVLSIRPYFDRGDIYVEFGTAYEAIINRIEI